MLSLALLLRVQHTSFVNFEHLVILYSSFLSSSMTQSNLCHETHCFLTTRHQAHSIHDTDNRTHLHASLPHIDPFDAKQNKNSPFSAAKSPRFLTALIPQQPPKLCSTFPLPTPATSPKTIAAHLTSQSWTFQAPTIQRPSAFPRNHPSSLVLMP